MTSGQEGGQEGGQVGEPAGGPRLRFALFTRLVHFSFSESVVLCAPVQVRSEIFMGIIRHILLEQGSRPRGINTDSSLAHTRLI